MLGKPNEIGARLRALRVQKGIGVRALARIIRRTPSWITRIETGRYFPTEQYILTVAPALKLDRRERSNLLALLQLYEIEHHIVESDGRAMAHQQRAIGRLLQNARV